MKNKETEQENQRRAEEFTWEEDVYEEKQTTENREEPEAEDLFAQPSEEKKEKKERLDLIYLRIRCRKPKSRRQRRDREFRAQEPESPTKKDCCWPFLRCVQSLRLGS